MWSLVTSRDAPGVTLMVEALSAVEGSGNRRPVLAIRCQDGDVALYVTTGIPAQTGSAGPVDRAPVRLFLDDRPPSSEAWPQSELENERALFAPEPRPLIHQLIVARRLRFEFTALNGKPAAVDFPVAGLLAATPPLSTACRSSWRKVLFGDTAMQPLQQPRTGLDGSQVYFEFQVEKQARELPGSPSPEYPAMLRSAKVEGEVLAQFVVDTLGRVEPGTFKVLKTTHELFTQAVRDVLPSLQFSPAEVGGRKVRQLVQIPFPFVLKG